MTKDEALRLALDSMKQIIDWYGYRDRNLILLNYFDQNSQIQKTMKSITAIKEALETEDKPVAWGMGKDGLIFDVICPAEHDREEGEYTIPLYTAPQRTWVGLTDEDIQKLAAEHHDWESLYLAVQAKLKERNT
jgi:hypothetical protein